jgi:type I restriction enzyme S subunit
MKTMKLGDACETINGLWTGKKGPFETAKVIRNTNFTKDCRLDLSNVAILEVEARQLSTRRLRKGDLVIEKSGGGPKQPVGRVVLFEEEGDNFSLSNFTSALRIKSSSSYVPKYLYYFILLQYVSGVTEKMQSNTTGIRNLNFKQYLDMDVPTPSLPEQKTIVEKLDAAFAEIDVLEANLETKSRYTSELLNSILGSAFSVGGVSAGPNQGTAMKTVKLGEVCNLVGGGTPSKKNSNYYTGSIPWITVRDMKQRWVESTEFCITEEAIKASATNLIPKNTVVIASRVGLGKVIQTSVPMAINQDLRAFIPKKPEILDSNFLFYWAQSIKDLIIGEGKGATVQGITLPFIQNLDLPLPSLTEQKAIVKKLDAAFAEIEKLRESTKQAKESFSALRQSILSSAFTVESNAA